MFKLFDYLYYCIHSYGAVLNPKESKESPRFYHAIAWILISLALYFHCLICFGLFTIKVTPAESQKHTAETVTLLAVLLIFVYSLTFRYLFLEKNAQRIIDVYCRIRSGRIKFDFMIGVLYFLLSVFSVPAMATVAVYFREMQKLQ